MDSGLNGQNTASNEMDQPLSEPTKRENMQINRTGDDIGKQAMNSRKILRIIREYFEKPVFQKVGM